MQTQVQFNRHVFDSYDNLKTYLSGDKAIFYVKKELQQVAYWIKLAEKVAIFCLKLLFVFITCGAAAEDVFRREPPPFEPSSQMKDWIGFAKNRPRRDIKDLTEHADLPTNQISDVKVRRHLPYPNLSFSGHHGICKGMSEWFLSIYFRTKNLSTNTKTHLKAIVFIFDEGGPKEATLLQTLDIKKGKMIGIKKAPLPSLIISARTPAGAEDIANLREGAYYVSTGYHAMVYIKEGSRSYFFDPNRGLAAMKGEEQGARLLERIHPSYSNPSTAHYTLAPFARLPHNHPIQFFRVHSRSSP